MEKRTASGKIYRLNNAPWPNAVVIFYLKNDVSANCELAIPQLFKATSTATGDISLDLLVGGNYQMKLPDGRVYEFPVTAELSDPFCVWDVVDETPPMFEYPQFVKLEEFDTTVAELRLSIEGLTVGGQPLELVTTDRVLRSGYEHWIEAPSLLNLALPANEDASARARMILRGFGNTVWRVIQGAGQCIQIGDKKTTVGVTGRIETQEDNAIIQLIYKENGLWFADGIQGNFEVI